MANSGSVTHRRCFWAIMFDGPTRDAITQFCESVKPVCRHLPLRWLPPENYHITLRFLGPLDDEQYTAALDHVSLAVTDFASFTLSLKHLLAFPQKRPKMLALHVRSSESILQLVTRIEQATVAIGLAPNNRPFLGHVSVAKLTQAYRKAIEFPAAMSEFDHDVRVNSIQMVQSETKPEGVEYTVLKTLPLGPAA